MDKETSTEIKHEINVFAAFRKHFIIFVAALVLLWLGWFISGEHFSMYAWPTYASLLWTFVLIIHFLIAYSSFRKIKKRSA